MKLELFPDELRRVYGVLDSELSRVAKVATERAIETAEELTPSALGNGLSGTGTRSGQMKARWAADSVTEPTRTAEGWVTSLNNNAMGSKPGSYYAAYVNDGHRMDRHFVPGLIVNPASGMLERVPKDVGGIMVGTKTSYVPGYHMVEEAERVYEETVEHEILKLLEELEDL